MQSNDSCLQKRDLSPKRHISEPPPPISTIAQECCVCLDRIPNVKMNPCLHCCCLQCVRLLKTCPLCRTPIDRILAKIRDENDQLVLELLQFYPVNEILYETLSSLIKGTSIEKTTSLMAQVGKKIGGHLSVVQTENLLTKAKEKKLLEYQMQNCLVVFCNQPWHISVDLGGCGVCYYGNLGTIPTLQGALDLLRDNYSGRPKKESVGN